MSNPANKRVAVVAQAVKLPGEEQGLDRIHSVCMTLANAGYNVTLYTSKFQHWTKQHRETWRRAYKSLPYNIYFLDEPGYKRNLDLKRILSHKMLAEELTHALEDAARYDLVYALIPPNDLARQAAEYARRHEIPFVVDVSDLWPEAMRMVFDVPVVSDMLFAGFAADATRVYELADAAIGTSDEYATRPLADNPDIPHTTVYVGNDLARFDKGADAYAGTIEKPADEVWVAYAGTLGASYDIATLCEAIAKANEEGTIPIRGKILGDGPDRDRFEKAAREANAPVDFLGYTDYEHMAAYLVKSDILVNSLVKKAPHSIVSKIADYLAAGRAMVNTGTSPEFCEKVKSDGFGVNVEPENSGKLAQALRSLADDESLRNDMGVRARSIAEEQFDRARAYTKITDTVEELIGKP